MRMVLVELECLCGSEMDGWDLMKVDRGSLDGGEFEWFWEW